MSFVAEGKTEFDTVGELAAGQLGAACGDDFEALATGLQAARVNATKAVVKIFNGGRVLMIEGTIQRPKTWSATHATGKRLAMHAGQMIM